MSQHQTSIHTVNYYEWSKIGNIKEQRGDGEKGLSERDKETNKDQKEIKPGQQRRKGEEKSQLMWNCYWEQQIFGKTWRRKRNQKRERKTKKRKAKESNIPPDRNVEADDRSGRRKFKMKYIRGNDKNLVAGVKKLPEER